MRNPGLSLTPVESGLYYLGISSWDNEPQSSLGYIFSNTEPTAQSNPTVPGNAAPLSNWNNNGQGSGTYTINLTTAFKVQPGTTLALVGGNVKLDGRNLQAPGGRVELGGVAGSGTIGLNVDGNNLRLSFPDGVARADVSLTNTADLNVSALRGGSIAINAQNLNLGRSRLLAGIDSGLGFIGSQSGNVEINATGSVNLTNDSYIDNVVRPGAVGKGGSINITTGYSLLPMVLNC